MLQLLETYVWAPDQLSASERREAEALVSDHLHAQEFVSFLQDIRAALRDDTSPVPDAVRAFAESLYTPPRRIRLERKPVATTDARTSLSVRTSFAAATATAPSRFRSLGSMLNRDEGILVRFLHDTQEHVVRGYILSNQDTLAAEMVAVVNGGAHIQCPDRFGVFELDDRKLGDLSTLADQSVDLLLPDASATVIPGEIGVVAVGDLAEVTVTENAVSIRQVAGSEGFVTMQQGTARSAWVVRDGDVLLTSREPIVVRAYALD